MINETKKSYKIVKINKLNIRYSYYKRKTSGPKVSVLFLSGYRSDMEGTKAKYLSNLSREIGFEFLKFDYSGHGNSEGNINEQCLSDWLNEANFFINKKLSFPIILVGSSMGGWLSILLGKKLKSKIKGIIGIGTAPDFTRQIIKNLSNYKKKIYKNKGFIKIKTKYDSDDYIFTKNFINDSKKHFVLESPIKINSIIHLLYGSFDEAVNLDSQLKLLKTLNSKITKLTIIKNSDHRMSSPSDLETLRQTFLQIIKDIL